MIYLAFPASSEMSSARLFLVTMSPIWLMGFRWKNSSMKLVSSLVRQSHRVGLRSLDKTSLKKFEISYHKRTKKDNRLTWFFMFCDISRRMKKCLIIPNLVLPPLLSRSLLRLARWMSSCTETSMRPSLSSVMASHVWKGESKGNRSALRPW